MADGGETLSGDWAICVFPFFLLLLLLLLGLYINMPLHYRYPTTTSAPFSTLLLSATTIYRTMLACMWHMQGLFLLPSFSLHFLFSPLPPSLSGYLGERCKIGQKKDRLSLYTTLQGWPIGRIAQERKNKMQLFYFLPLLLFFPPSCTLKFGCVSSATVPVRFNIERPVFFSFSFCFSWIREEDGSGGSKVDDPTAHSTPSIKDVLFMEGREREGTLHVSFFFLFLF
ncbi:hypothetical protein F4809DRAFT_613398 [Biscogniauxia mediterranea]|nr:hypothetical protein F4809DRAFT_613398 [Biscogniauxia mediterranea]